MPARKYTVTTKVRRAIAHVRAVFPDAEPIRAREQYIVFSGCEADHRKVKEILAQLQEEEKGEPHFETYPLAIDAELVERIVKPFFGLDPNAPFFDVVTTPGFRMAANVDRKLLFAMGRKVDHENVKKVLRALEGTGQMEPVFKGGPSVESYSLTDVSGNIGETIREFFPGLRLAWSPSKKVFFATGYESELDNLKKMLEEIKKAGSK